MEKIKDIKERPYTPFEMSDIVERMIAMNSVVTPVDYGTGEKFNSTEVHILSHIAQFPGISVTEMARDWNRTKGAISQIIKKLEAKELIRKEKRPGNEKTISLFVTEKGARLDEVHREYDTRNYIRFLNILKEKLSEESIQEAFHVMEAWIELSMDWIPE